MEYQEGFPTQIRIVSVFVPNDKKKEERKIPTHSLLVEVKLYMIKSKVHSVTYKTKART